MSEDDMIFVTNDRALQDVGKLDPIDEEIVESAQTGEGTIAITSPEMLSELMRMAGETHNLFMAKVKDLIDQDRAQFVRDIRVDEGYSWRAVASRCYHEWDGDWTPPSNQIMGMALCEVAAEYFSEHYMDDVWNG